MASCSARVTAERRGRAPGLAQRPVVGDEDPVERGGGEGPARIERVHDVQAGLGCRGRRRRRCRRRPGRRRRPRRSPASARTPSLVPVEDPAALGPLGGHGDVVERPAPGVIGQGHGAGDGAGGDLRQEALALLGRTDLADHRGELGDGGQQGPGGDDPAQLLGDDGHLDEGEADAAVLLGDGQGGPVEGDHGAPRASRAPARSPRRPARPRRGHSFSRNERTEERSSSCSLVNSSSTALPSRRCRKLFDPRSMPAARRQNGASVPDARVSLPGLVLPSRRSVFWEVGRGVPPGGSPVRGASPGRRCRGLGGAVTTPLRVGDGRSPTLFGAPLAQRQSNGLLIRRFRVRIPRGAPPELGFLIKPPSSKTTLRLQFVVVRGTRTEVAPGKWRLRVYIGRRPDGSPIQVSRTVHGGVRAADRELASMVSAATKGKLSGGTETVQQLLELWGEHCEEQGRSPTTIRRVPQDRGQGRQSTPRETDAEQARRPAP